MTSFYAIILFIVAFIAIMVIASISTPKKEELPNNISDELIKEVALNGEKLKAIKWYKMFHHVRLKEAKDAVEQLIKGETPPNEKGKISQTKIEEALKNGNKIEAIKLYRASHNVGLKEAKDAIDAMEEALL